MRSLRRSCVCHVMSTRTTRMRRARVLVMSSWSCCDGLMAAIMDGDVQAFTGLEALSSSVLLLSVPVLLCSCCVPSMFFFEYSFLSTATCAPPASLLRPSCVSASLCVPLPQHRYASPMRLPTTPSQCESCVSSVSSVPLLFIANK